MEVLRASSEHVADLARLRVALLEETGAQLQDEARAELLRSNEVFFRANQASDAWASWVAVFSGQVGAIGTLAFWDRPPYPGNPHGKDAYLLNMFTAPWYRGLGAATAILNAALAEARQRGVCKLVLHATEAGARLYVKAGFVGSPAYMELPFGNSEA